MSKWSDRDKAHLWHPLTQHGLHPNHKAIVEAKGIYLIDEVGERYIDAISSWYTCMYGHSNPHIVNRVKKGLDQLDQVVFSGFTHPPAIQFSESLTSILPGDLTKVFFSDNGSTAVDVALKMAFQFHFNQGQKRNKVVALSEGFHGDTFGAMSVSDLSVYNGPFEQFFLEVERFDWQNNTLGDFEKMVSQESVASFIYEPLVQGAAGMKMIPAHLLNDLLLIAKKHGVVCIADEVMTGFGKTGSNFASDQITTKPDIMCLAKSLTGGIAPMAVTVATQNIYNAFLSDQLVDGFFHGHTYSANPLACNAATAAIELLTSQVIVEGLERIGKQNQSFIKKLKGNKKVKNLRHIGVIMALDLVVEGERYGKSRDKLFNFFMSKGVFLRPLGNTIYIVPPFTIGEQELNYLHQIIEESLDII